MSPHHFNPPSPCGEGLECIAQDIIDIFISIHPPRAGRDPLCRYRNFKSLYFNPPSPCGEGPGIAFGVKRYTNISIHPPRAGRDSIISLMLPPPSISIHPPRAGRDVLRHLTPPSLYDFNPPSPCGEGQAFCATKVFQLAFQSTLPVRGGTLRPLLDRSVDVGFQSTLPVRGGTSSVCHPSRTKLFQSTLPVRGGTEMIGNRIKELRFQSTLPVRGGTPAPQEFWR